MSQQLFSLAFGVGTQNRQNNWLEVFYAQPLLKPSAELLASIAPILGYNGGNQAISFSTSQAEKLAEAVKPIDALQAALRTGDPARVEQAITNLAVETDVIARVEKRARKNGAPDETVRRLADLYTRGIIPLSRKIQVHALLASPA